MRACIALDTAFCGAGSLIPPVIADHQERDRRHILDAHISRLCPPALAVGKRLHLRRWMARMLQLLDRRDIR
jgi:hypothetical protein